MSILTSLGILILSMLITAFLQLAPGVFALFSHYASGKYSHRKASDLALFFIFGVETAIVITFVFTYLLLTALYSNIANLNILLYILCGILAALGIVCLFFYFRQGPGTRLFIPRQTAKNFDEKARLAKTRSDAFILGITSTIPELIFTIPLYIISALQIMYLGEPSIVRALLIALFVLVAISSLLILAFRQNSYHLADYLRFRFKNKNFFRGFLSISYLIIVILILTELTT